MLRSFVSLGLKNCLDIVHNSVTYKATMQIISGAYIQFQYRHKLEKLNKSVLYYYISYICHHLFISLVNRTQIQSLYQVKQIGPVLLYLVYIYIYICQHLFISLVNRTQVQSLYQVKQIGPVLLYLVYMSTFIHFTGQQNTGPVSLLG